MATVYILFYILMLCMSLLEAFKRVLLLFSSIQNEAFNGHVYMRCLMWSSLIVHYSVMAKTLLLGYCAVVLVYCILTVTKKAYDHATMQ